MKSFNTVITISKVSEHLGQNGKIFFITDQDGKEYSHFQDTNRFGSWDRHLKKGITLKVFVKITERNGKTYLNILPDRMYPNPI